MRQLNLLREQLNSDVKRGMNNTEIYLQFLVAR